MGELHSATLVTPGFQDLAKIAQVAGSADTIGENKPF
jgi:hypothetical protein